MSVRERDRERILKEVIAGKKRVRDAADDLDLTTRQVRRIRNRYEADGAKGLLHAALGRPGARGRSAEDRRKALDLVREKYPDFGPTHAAEMLERHHGLKVDHETLRRWMIAAGMRSVARERKHRMKRLRRPRSGELAQMDGSHHRWFEDRGPACCLMVMIDDATGERLALFSEQETTEAALTLLRTWLERRGIPQALYVDGRTTFFSEDGRTENTDFGKVCRKLGIRIIRARSPQAKGRVERSNGVFQDRLVKEMRLEDVRDVEGGNRFFDGWIDEHSRRFAKPPADPAPAHRSIAGLDLDRVFAPERERVVHGDSTVRLNNRWFQLLGRDIPARGSRVTLRTLPDGTVEILHRDRVLSSIPLIGAPPAPPPPPAKPRVPPPPRKPAEDHPWRGAFKGSPSGDPPSRTSSGARSPKNAGGR